MRYLPNQKRPTNEPPCLPEYETFLSRSKCKVFHTISFFWGVPPVGVATLRSSLFARLRPPLLLPKPEARPDLPPSGRACFASLPQPKKPLILSHRMGGLYDIVSQL